MLHNHAHGTQVYKIMAADEGLGDEVEQYQFRPHFVDAILRFRSDVDVARLNKEQVLVLIVLQLHV